MRSPGTIKIQDAPLKKGAGQPLKKNIFWNVKIGELCAGTLFKGAYFISNFPGLRSRLPQCR